MARRPQQNSIYQIAKEAGVSAATVSRAINNRVGVSEEVRAKISQLLSKYNFTPNYPSSRRTRIAFITAGDDTSGYMRRALAGIFEYARPQEQDVSLIFRYDDSGAQLLQRLRDLQCSAIIAGPGEHFKDAEKELSDTGLPVIFLDSTVDLPRLGYIANDSYSGSFAAARHLLELGHRNIGYLLHYDLAAFDHRQRFKGYKDAMQEAGIEINPKWVAQSPSLEKPKRGAAGIATMNVLLQQAPELTAVMAVDDDMALGALTAIHQSGKKISEDISITGFDNCDDTANWFPALTTVDHAVERAGFMAAEAIGQALKNPGDWTPPRITLPTKLIVRNSTGPMTLSKNC